MVQDRKEPTINSIAPDRDEILTHQNRLSGKRPPPPNQRPGGRPVVKSSPLGGFALILALAAVAGAGFSGWQLYETQKSLEAAGGRIAELEARLQMTDSESSQSVTAIHEKLEWADSEIRKLWGVSYDTNRKAIAVNQDSITAVSGRLNDANEAAKEAKQIADSATKRVSEQQLVVDRVVEDVNIQEQQIKQITELSKKVETLAKQLETRMANSEEAIEAINAFRRSANADIQLLKQRLGSSG